MAICSMPTKRNKRAFKQTVIVLISLWAFIIGVQLLAYHLSPAPETILGTILYNLILSGIFGFGIYLAYWAFY